jgi:hypothetical protein
MFIAALFTIAELWKQPVNGLRNVVFIQNEILFSHKE